MHRHHRRIVRRVQAADLHVRIAEAPADLRPFVELYEQTMTRTGADSFYLYPGEYWTSLARDVPLVQVEVLRGDTLLASVLGLTGPPWLHYHLGGSSEPGRTIGAMHLALYELARWGQQRGYRALHLGGGVGGRKDSLYLFKERFAPAGHVPSGIGRAVHDPVRYRQLTGQQEISWEGFFPAYRSPR